MMQLRIFLGLFFFLYFLQSEFVRPSPVPLMPPPTVQAHEDHKGMSKKPEDAVENTTIHGVRNQASDGTGSNDDNSLDESDHNSSKLTHNDAHDKNRENFINPKVSVPNKPMKEGTLTKEGHEAHDYQSDGRRSQDKTPTDAYRTTPRVKPFDYTFAYLMSSVGIIFVVFAIGASVLRNMRCRRNGQSSESTTPVIEPQFEILPEDLVEREPIPSTSKGLFVPNNHADRIGYRPIDLYDDDDQF